MVLAVWSGESDPRLRGHRGAVVVEVEDRCATCDSGSVEECNTLGMSLRSLRSVRSVFSAYSVDSLASVGSSTAVGSAGSIASIGSAGSILSIGSAGSILSFGSAGSLLSVGSAGSILSRNSEGAILCRDNVPMKGAELAVHVGVVVAIGLFAGAVTGSVARFLDLRPLRSPVL